MTEVTWGPLAKAIADLTTVSEEIDADILTHNEDPSSHSQANEALYNHKIAEVLDHLDEAIRNVKIYAYDRTYRAIVATDGTGDYTDIQDAIDYVNGKGGGKILIRAGTYTITTAITLYDRIELVGEGEYNTILYFDSANKNIQIQGTFRDPTYTTFSIAYGSNTLTAVDSLFTSEVSVGDFVRLNNQWYKIKTVDSNTQLTLEDTYRGTAIVNSDSLNISDLITDVKISNLEIRHVTGTSFDTGSGIYCRYTYRLHLENITVRDCDYYGATLEHSRLFRIDRCSFVDNDLTGLFPSNHTCGLIINCTAYSNTQSGFMVSASEFTTLVLIDCISYQNGDHGFKINFASYCVFHACYAYQNVDDGFYLYGSDYNRISGCFSYDNRDWGINISNANCDKNIISNNILLQNDDGQFNDIGTATIDDNNIVA